MGSTSKISEIAPAAPRAADDEAVFEFEGFRLDVGERTLRRQRELIPLTAKVFDTLTLLVRHRGRVASKEYLMAALWPDTFVEEVNLSQNISVLRKALGESAQNSRLIITVPGVGYRFTPPVTVLTGDAPAPVTARSAERARHRFLRGRSGLVGAAAMCAAIAALAVVVWYQTERHTGRLDFQPENVRTSRVTASGRSPNTAISPDGLYVAYTENEGDEYSLWVKHLSSGGKAQLVSGQPSVLMALTFSPDGNYLYFTRLAANRAEMVLYRIPAIGGTPQPVLSNVDTPVSFSPDGGRFVFMRHTADSKYQLVIASAAGGVERILGSRESPRMFSYVGPSWSPDGKTVAASAAVHRDQSRWSIDLVSADDGSSRELYSSSDQIGRVRWLPDGSGLLAVISKTLPRLLPPWQPGTMSHVTGGAIWRVSYPDGRAERLTDDLTDYDVCCIDLTGSGHTIAAVQNLLVSDLWIAAAHDVDKPKQITWSEPVFRRHAWLADNETIVYRDLKGGLNAVHKDGRPIGLSMPDQHAVVSGVSACGSGHVIFQTAPGNTIWRVNTETSSATRLTDGAINAYPSCSADGQWIVYSSKKSAAPSIWRLPVAGGEPVPLIRQDSLEALPSPSGLLLYYMAQQWDEQPAPGRRFRWVVVSTSTWEPVLSVDRQFDGSLGVSPVWAPDESGLDYVVTRAGVSNLWRQPLDGRPPVQLTHFASGRIFSFAWSPDGHWLSIGSGANRSDAVLLSTTR